VTDPTWSGRPATILLTGSNGSIGHHLGSLLSSHGHHVRGLDIRGPANHRGDHHMADLRDLGAVRAAVQGVDAIVHAGAIPTDTGDASTVIGTNVLGTWNVLQAALEAGVRRVVSFSSINAQGSVGGLWPTEYLPIDDGYPPHPMSPYQLSKHLGEEICRSFSERHGIVTLCLRPVWVPRPDDYASAGFGTAPFLAAWRDDYWAYVDVRDVGDAVVRCLQLEGVLHDRFLLAAADTSAHLPTSTLVEQEFPTVPWPNLDLGAYLAGHPYRSLIDCGHARTVLGWEPRHTWRDAQARPAP
jgi:UDP-glucose 4-epimerase